MVAQVSVQNSRPLGGELPSSGNTAPADAATITFCSMYICDAPRSRGVLSAGTSAPGHCCCDGR